MQVDDGEGSVCVCGMAELLNERSSEDPGLVIRRRKGLLGVEGMGRQGLDHSVLARGRAGLDGMRAVVEEKDVGVGSPEVGVKDGGLDEGGAGGTTVGCVLADEISEMEGWAHLTLRTTLVDHQGARWRGHDRCSRR